MNDAELQADANGAASPQSAAIDDARARLDMARTQLDSERDAYVAGHGSYERVLACEMAFDACKNACARVAASVEHAEREARERREAEEVVRQRRAEREARARSEAPVRKRIGELIEEVRLSPVSEEDRSDFVRAQMARVRVVARSAAQWKKHEEVCALRRQIGDASSGDAPASAPILLEGLERMVACVLSGGATTWMQLVANAGFLGASADDLLEIVGIIAHLGGPDLRPVPATPSDVSRLGDARARVVDAERDASELATRYREADPSERNGMRSVLEDAQRRAESARKDASSIAKELEQRGVDTRLIAPTTAAGDIDDQDDGGVIARLRARLSGPIASFIGAGAA